MGCDIHLYAEFKNSAGKWITADTWEKDEDDPSRYRVDYKRRFYSGRNYDLFAMLANVRNGRGFAGIKTGEGFEPISMPRGVPEDACPGYLQEVAHWDADGHSHSYLTLAELLAYDWTQTAHKQGWVNPIEWAEWRDNGKPTMWSGGVGGGNTTHHDNDEFEEAWQKLRAERGYPLQRWATAHLTRHAQDSGDLARFIALVPGALTRPYTLVKWTVPYYHSAGEFLSTTIPRLLRLGKPDDVRIVFFFDN